MSFAGVWGAGLDIESSLSAMLEALARPRRVPAVPTRIVRSRVGLGYVPTVDSTQLQSPPTSLPELDLHFAGDLRIDNREELRERLGLVTRVSDAHLLLEAYARWGHGCVDTLVGDFAFAIWSGRTQQLFLSRDPCGVRPLFFAQSAGRLAFGSHQRALLANDWVSSELDERSVLDYLGEFPQAEERTFFRGVTRLAPGSSLTVELDGRADQRRYFRPENIPETRLASDDEYAGALLSELRRSTASRAPASVASAVMLSGGLDSTMVTLLAAEQAPIQTISAVFPGVQECDERHFQAAVVAKARSKHLEIRPDPNDESGDFSRLFSVFAEPGPIGAHWLSWAAAEAASARGAQVMLTGIDGDRVVSHGAGRLTDLAQAHDWIGLAREAYAVKDFGWQRKARVTATQALGALLPHPFMAALERRQPSPKAFHDALALIQSGPLSRQSVVERLQAVPVRSRGTRADHLRSLATPDRNWDTELLDHLGAAFGLEFRHPFFDRRVVELCVSFPGEQKRQGGWSRFVLRNAMRGIAPDAVRERTLDASFDRPFWNWARGWLLGDPSRLRALSNLEPYLDLQALNRLINRMPKEPANWPVDLVWRCVILSHWLRASSGVSLS